MEDVCALCGMKRPLMKSHIIPKFVTDWIKKTSITQGLRIATNKNKRVEDGVKKRLLCEECEKKFSKYETYFSKTIFHPYLKGADSFDYDWWLNKFISSLSWRILFGKMKEYIKEHPEYKELILESEKKLKGYLLGKNELPLRNYLFFFEEDKLNYHKIDRRFHWYMQRATDGTIVSSKEVLFLYVKFPKMFFVTQIKPLEFFGGDAKIFEDGEGNFLVEGESNLISEKGTIKKRPLVFYPSFEDFLLSRVEEANLDELSAIQKQKIYNLIEKNKDKILGSEIKEI